MGKGSRVLLVLLALAVVLVGDDLQARRKRINLNAVYLTPFGPVRFKQKGKQVEGYLLRSSGTCPFLKGDKMFEGVLMGANLTGKLRICREGGSGCEGEYWAFTVAVVAEGGKKISGSAYAGGGSCMAPGLLAGKGVMFFRYKFVKPRRRAIARKAKSKPKPKSQPQAQAKAAPNPEPKPESSDKDIIGPLPEPGSYNPLLARNTTKLDLPTKDKVEELLREGEAYLHAGRPIQARKRFKAALKLDPKNAVALGGIGVTYYFLKDYDKALTYYRKAVAADPNYGDGYYNMACIYALKGQKKLAIKYLKISVMQGFKDISVALEDPDLQSLRGDPEFEALVRGNLK